MDWNYSSIIVAILYSLMNNEHDMIIAMWVGNAFDVFQYPPYALCYAKSITVTTVDL